MPQETMLFNGSVYDNILYGRLDATEEEVMTASVAANAHNFIMELPNGYDTQLGDRGVNISGVANSLTDLGFKILNVITWAKTNPPPNISCRYFTYSTEFIIWARKWPKKPHHYNYEMMKYINGGKQMTDVWRLPAIAPWEKSCGKHPTQKPLALLTRIILASTNPGEWILDPFAGSSTTGIAANLINRRYLGIDRELGYVELSKNRRIELDDYRIRHAFRSKIKDIKLCESFEPYGLVCENDMMSELPF